MDSPLRRVNLVDGSAAWGAKGVGFVHGAGHGDDVVAHGADAVDGGVELGGGVAEAGAFEDARRRDGAHGERPVIAPERDESELGRGHAASESLDAPAEGLARLAEQGAEILHGAPVGVEGADELAVGGWKELRQARVALGARGFAGEFAREANGRVLRETRGGKAGRRTLFGCPQRRS